MKARSDFFRHVLTLGTGTILAQSVTVFVSPVLTRLYTPEAFGLLALFLSLTALVGIASSGKYEFAILIPENDDEAFDIVALCGFLLLFSTLVISLVMFGQLDPLIRVMHLPGSAFLCMIPAAVFFMGLFRVLGLWFNRKKRYRLISIGRILQTSVAAALGILFGFLGDTQYGLIWSSLIGYGAAAVLLVFLLVQKDRNRAGGLTWQGMLEAARSHSNFPKYSIFSSALEMAAMQMPLIFFPMLFGPAVAGWFALSQRVTKAPLNLLTRAVGDVFRQEASRRYVDSGGCRKLFLETFKRLAGISVIPFAVLFIAAPELFSFVFGETWRIAGHYTRILVFSYWLQFIGNPLANVLLIAGKQRMNMFIQVFNLAAVAGAMVIGNRIGEVSVSLYLLMAAGCIKYSLQMTAAYAYSNRNPPVRVELTKTARKLTG